MKRKHLRIFFLLWDFDSFSSNLLTRRKKFFLSQNQLKRKVRLKSFESKLDSFHNFSVLENLSKIAGNLRDNFRPSPKIYSLKEHVPNLKTEKTQRAWELFHLLSKDAKVVSLIDSFEFDSNWSIFILYFLKYIFLHSILFFFSFKNGKRCEKKGARGWKNRGCLLILSKRR